MKPLLLLCALFASAYLAAAEPAAFHMWNDRVPPPEKPGVEFPEIPGARQVRVFTGDPAVGAYNHHANLIFANGRFHLSWSNQRYAEDAPGQRVLYSSSADGVNWEPVRELFPAPHPEAPWEHSGVFATSLGFFVRDGRLFAKANTTVNALWQNCERTKSSPVYTKECGYPVYRALTFLYREIGSNGKLGPILAKNPAKLPDDLLFPVAATPPGFAEPEAPCDIADAVRQNPENRRFCEPVTWKAADGRHVLLLRDDSRSNRKWVSFSGDGKKWTQPVPTDIPDSPSWSCQLTLDDGTVLLFGNHHGKGYVDQQKRWRDRDPLMVSVSRDGILFDNTHAVASGYYRHLVSGVRGRGGSAQYPCVILRDGTCLVAYSLGKESIGVTSFPVAELLKAKGN